MAIAPGTRLGPYEITSPLGVGGMGEVYRALDINLKRATAIKVLPESVSTDPDRLARFQREAEVLAALNHPNIAAVYGLERSGASIAMAMELVEGPTLAERIVQGPVPVEETLAIARQIAEGLEAAHEQGIVHRDLKPANVKLRPDGTVKILDFGLAKALEPAAAVSAVTSLSPTITSPALTQMGMLLGTAAYMSPEQARGRPVDKRADIWAFGCVVFELLTGRRAFEGEDVSMTLAEVMKSTPDWTALPPLPPTVLLCLQRCLIKDVRLRLRDIGEMRLALAGAFDVQQLIGPSVEASPQVTRVPWRWLVPAATISAIAAAAAVWWLQPPPAPPPEAPLPQVVRFDINAPVGSRILPGTPAISPDGGNIAYSMAGPDRVPRLYVRSMQSAEARVLPGTENGVHPFWSPDGRSLAFVIDRTLKRIDLAGSMPRELATVSGPWHGSWGRSGEILFSALGIRRISAEGGTSEPAVVLDEKTGEIGGGFPAFLTDGRRFIVRIERKDESALELASLDSKERTKLVDNVLSAPFLVPTPGGVTYLMYLRDEALVVHELDEAAGRMRGTPRVLIEGMGRVANPPMMPTLGISPSGVIAYQVGGGFTSMVLHWIDPSGNPISETPLDVTGQNPTLSPDGRQLALDVLSGNDRDIWVTDVARGVTSRVTHGGGQDRSPAWSPDGQRIAFSRGKKLFVVRADGNESETELATVDGLPQSWSPDGKYLLYQAQRQLFLWSFADSMSMQVGARAGTSRWGQFSPDSRAIAYTSDESGRDEVYIQMAPPASGRVRVSTTGGSLPHWGRTSSELFFLAADRSMTSVNVQIGETLSAGTPRTRFPLQAGAVFTNVRYDFDPLRQRFLVPRIQAESVADTPITVVLNWWTEFVKRPD